MATLDGARELATSIATVASDAGLPTVSLITDMNEPLASAAGNAVEIRSAVDYLTGARRDERLDRVTMALGAELLALSGLARDVDAGVATLKTRARERRRCGAVRAHGRGARRADGFHRARGKGAASSAGRRRRDA